MPSQTAHYTLHSSRVLFLTREGRDGECVSPLFGASLVPHLRHLRHKHKSASLWGTWRRRTERTHSRTGRAADQAGARAAADGPGRVPGGRVPGTRAAAGGPRPLWHMLLAPYSLLLTTCSLLLTPCSLLLAPYSLLLTPYSLLLTPAPYSLLQLWPDITRGTDFNPN